MDELAAVRMKNLEAVIAGVGDAIDADHGLDVVNVSPGYDGDVDVRQIGQPLQNVLRLGRQYSQVRMGGDRCQGAVVVQEQCQLVILADVSGGHASLFNCQLSYRREQFAYVIMHYIFLQWII